MLVRDEQENIERALTQTFGVVDHVTILDTGSTDGTPEIAKALLTESGIDWYVGERVWDGFGPSRTALLELDRQWSHCDYTLMLDADHTLTVTGERPELEVDAYLMPVRGSGDSWRLPLLTRTQHPFRYRGAAHSYLAAATPFSEAHTDWLSITGGGGVTREKLERDRVLLEQEFLNTPEDPRTVHYLAQTYRDLDLIDQAIRFYRLRANMDGFDEERYWARYQLGCLLGSHVSFDQAADELLAAWRERPHRIEALRALGNLAHSVADKYPVPDDILFVRRNDYRQEAA
jgi:glycosyltransferase involved in cell wall biosynthesis